jgi:hypothetical protein
VPATVQLSKVRRGQQLEVLALSHVQDPSGEDLRLQQDAVSAVQKELLLDLQRKDI